MEFNYDETAKLTRVTISKEEDICAKCNKKLREVCPLLMGIVGHIVYPCANSMILSSCVLYDSLKKWRKEMRKVKKSQKEDVT